MRERYLQQFDRIWIDCLNGDKYKTGKLTPEGQSDPSIFSTEFNREGIQVGTSISLLVRRSRSVSADTIHFRDLWGEAKRLQLIEEPETGAQPKYHKVDPRVSLGCPSGPY